MEKNRVSETEIWVADHLRKIDPDAEWHPDTERAFVRFTFQQHVGNKGRFGLLMVLLAGGVCLIVLAGGGLLRHKPSSHFVENDQVSAALAKTKLGQQAPEFRLTDASGSEIRLSDLRGNVVLVNFWATWCTVCRVEIPWFINFYNTYKSRGLIIIGISLDDKGWKVVNPFFQRLDLHVNYPLAIGNDALAKEYGVDGLPMTVLINRRGEIVSSRAGKATTESHDEYESEILDLLKDPSH